MSEELIKKQSKPITLIVVGVPNIIFGLFGLIIHNTVEEVPYIGEIGISLFLVGVSMFMIAVVWLTRIKDVCCIDGNMALIENDNKAQCIICKRIFIIKDEATGY